MKEAGYHLACDLFNMAGKYKDQPRFFVPNENGFSPVSWNEYAEKVKAVAGYLISTGFGVQDKAAILGQNSFNWCAAQLGIHSARGVVVPIYPASQPEMLEYFLEHSDARVLFCDSAFLPVISKIKRAKVQSIIVLDDAKGDYDLSLVSFSEAVAEGAKHLENVEKMLETVSNEDIASIIYTSGTTGLPKGVMLTHANSQSSAADWISLNEKNIPEQAVDIHWLPLSHTFGSGSIMLGNRLGWQSYFVSHKDIIEKMPEIKPHIFLSVPAYWEKIYNQMQSLSEEGFRTSRNDNATDMKNSFDTVTGGRLVFGLSGGAGLKKEIKEGFHNIGLTIIEGYGLTECSPTLTMNRKEKFNFDSVGIPFPSVQVKLADDGEILAKGPNIFAGYYKDEKATGEAFDENGWFKTGDVGVWTEDGFLKIIDRKKEILVTSGGKNVPPQNIERMFQDDTLINHFVVYGDGKKYLTALVTVNEELLRKQTGKDMAVEDLLNSEEVHKIITEKINRVNEKLASYETIKKFWLCPEQLSVEANLLTSSLKIRRRAIYDKYREKLENLYS